MHVSNNLKRASVLTGEAEISGHITPSFGGCTTAPSLTDDGLAVEEIPAASTAAL
jgi:hypothetical protein